MREHGMGSVLSRLAYHGGVIPSGAAFLVFSDCMRPLVWLSALSHLGSIWVYTDDLDFSVEPILQMATDLLD